MRPCEGAFFSWRSRLYFDIRHEKINGVFIPRVGKSLLFSRVCVTLCYMSILLAKTIATAETIGIAAMAFNVLSAQEKISFNLLEV